MAKRAASGVAPRPKLKELDLRWMNANEPPEADFVVEHIAARGCTTLLWGPAGQGKSLFSEAATRGVARGKSVAGLRCKKGTVVYIDGENGPNEIHRRVRNLDLPSKGVTIYDASVGGLHLARDTHLLERVLDKKRPDLVVLDSFRRLTPGTEENDSDETALVMASLHALAEHYQCAVIIIHHARKDGKEYRGSTALIDQVSIAWDLSRTNRLGRVLKNGKMRVAAEPSPIHFQLVPDGKSIDIEAATAPADSAALSSSLLLEQVSRQIEDEPGISKRTLRDAIGGDHRKLDAAVKELVEAGFIELRTGGRSAQLHHSIRPYRQEKS